MRWLTKLTNPGELDSTGVWRSVGPQIVGGSVLENFRAPARRNCSTAGSGALRTRRQPVPSQLARGSRRSRCARRDRTFGSAPEGPRGPAPAVQTDRRSGGRLPVLELVIGYPRRDGPSHAGAAVADVGAHPSTVRSTAQASDTTLSIIDFFPRTWSSVRRYPRPQPAMLPARQLERSQYPKGADAFPHDETDRGKRLRVGDAVCPRGRDQDNPLLVNDNDPERRTSGQSQEAAPLVPHPRVCTELGCS
jgi:hypothetical protein